MVRYLYQNGCLRNAYYNAINKKRTSIYHQIWFDLIWFDVTLNSKVKVVLRIPGFMVEKDPISPLPPPSVISVTRAGTVVEPSAWHIYFHIDYITCQRLQLIKILYLKKVVWQMLWQSFHFFLKTDTSVKN